MPTPEWETVSFGIAGDVFRLRVPGGWLYQSVGSGSAPMAFVKKPGAGDTDEHLAGALARAIRMADRLGLDLVVRMDGGNDLQPDLICFSVVNRQSGELVDSLCVPEIDVEGLLWLARIIAGVEKEA